MDEALATAAENLAQLEHMHEVKSALNLKLITVMKIKLVRIFFYACLQVLRTGLAQQVNKDRARLETEIRHVADKATNAIQKWYGYCHCPKCDT